MNALGDAQFSCMDDNQQKHQHMHTGVNNASLNSLAADWMSKWTKINVLHSFQPWTKWYVADKCLRDDADCSWVRCSRPLLEGCRCQKYNYIIFLCPLYSTLRKATWCLKSDGANALTLLNTSCTQFLITLHVLCLFQLWYSISWQFILHEFIQLASSAH